MTEIFSNYGDVVNCELIVDREVGLSRGYAFIEFKKTHEGEEAVRCMDKAHIDGKACSVKYMDAQKKKRKEQLAQEKLEMEKDPEKRMIQQAAKKRAADIAAQKVVVVVSG